MFTDLSQKICAEHFITVHVAWFMGQWMSFPFSILRSLASIVYSTNGVPAAFSKCHRRARPATKKTTTISNSIFFIYMTFLSLSTYKKVVNSKIIVVRFNAPQLFWDKSVNTFWNWKADSLTLFQGIV